jgi:hypothetical protein
MSNNNNNIEKLLKQSWQDSVMSLMITSSTYLHKKFIKSDSNMLLLHRCTRVENPGEGVRDVFAKIPRGGQGFQEKLPGGVHLFCVLLHFY